MMAARATGSVARYKDWRYQLALEARFARHSSFWAELDKAGRRKLLSLGRTKLYREDGHSFLYLNGAIDDRVIVLLSGHVKVTSDVLHRSSRQPAPMSLRYPGQLIGEQEALQRSGTAIRKVTASVLGVVEGLVIEARAFQGFLDGHPTGWPALTTELSGRLFEAETRLDAMSDSANERLARTLASLIDPSEALREGSSSIMLPLTQADLAALIGTSRETVERTLRTWRARSIVQTAQRSITVLRPDQLMRIAGIRSVFRPSQPSDQRRALPA
ncbi:Crp/Fnr family transcriptional regulator [Microbispora triticiradicis]|uniref:Crp/Fnr family transcriptional regulator n=2 Tax=Microbispora TaxID=2005 RepID=A0ABY3LQ43_9ACTN|nr:MULTISPECIES: Crp/Fnr family transcriptional regulator [Microbispora]TLP66541.1 Crp/Fnr family transcriptional regulator [Microbispora fusca]TYB47434.1 Crp/Fnr family transcriptional regulator [Microbispora tritici]